MENKKKLRPRVAWRSSSRLPAEYCEEYCRERTPFVRRRVGVYFIAATIIYLSAAGQYGLREFLFHPGDNFRIAETPIIASLIAAATLAYLLNRRSRSLIASKLCAFFYTLAFLAALISYGLVYPEHAFLFVFYYGAALILGALMIPWELWEVMILFILYTGAHLLYLGILVFIQGRELIMFPRFHPLVDGLIYMGICGAVSLSVRHQDIAHDTRNFVLLKQIEAQKKQFEKELELAHLVHKTLIPASISTAKADIAVTYIPMGYVGGDCAKFLFLEDDKLVLFISDVTGHGVPAALLVNRVHAEFERLVREDPAPGALLKNLNRFISRDFSGTGMYLSAFYGMIDFKDKTFRYSNYGHPPQYLYRVAGRKIASLEPHTTFLGAVFDETEHHEAEISFERDDQILLFTDGVLETSDGAGEFYGEERLLGFIQRNAGEVAGFNERLIEDLKKFGLDGFGDDVFILNVKIKKEF